MSAEAVPTAPPPQGWTIADVDALPERDGVRYELVDGVPHVMSPPRGDHQDALLELHLALRASAPAGSTSCRASAWCWPRTSVPFRISSWSPASGHGR
jgi:hypothetical protein